MNQSSRNVHPPEHLVSIIPDGPLANLAPAWDDAFCFHGAGPFFKSLFRWPEADATLQMVAFHGAFGAGQVAVTAYHNCAIAAIKQGIGRETPRRD